MPDDAAGVRFTVLDPVEGPASPIESVDDGRLTDFATPTTCRRAGCAAT
jgi:hypothetical protein